MKQPSPSGSCRNSRDAGYSSSEMMRHFPCFLQARVWSSWGTHPTSPHPAPSRLLRPPLLSLCSAPLNLYFGKCFIFIRQRSGLLKKAQPMTDHTVSVPESVSSSRAAAPGAPSPPRRPDRRARLPARPTFEQLHRPQLEGNAVPLGEDVDGAARLGQQVQVELQAHGGSSGPSPGSRPGYETGNRNGWQKRPGHRAYSGAQPGVEGLGWGRVSPATPSPAHWMALERFGPISGSPTLPLSCPWNPGCSSLGGEGAEMFGL